MKKTIALITVLLLILTMFSGCSMLANLADKDKGGEEVTDTDSGKKDETEDKGSDQTIKSDASSISFVFSSDWSEVSLVEDASIEMANLAAEKYFVVIEESVVDFEDDFTIEDYAKIIMDQMESGIENGEKTGPEKVTIGDNIPAVQYELAGSIDKIKIKYVLTCFEHDGIFYQALAWSLQSKYDDVKPDFLKVLNSVSFDR